VSTYHRRQRTDVRQALDEARFGSQRTLNLRESLPTVADAVARTEAWLRERQVTASGEVLIITGRGKGSADGVSPVREAVQGLLGSLRRRGVVTEFVPHTAGSFVVTLAPMAMLLDAPRRKRDQGRPPTAPALRVPPHLSALDPSTQALLRDLAIRSLAALGTTVPDHFVEGEMVRQFEILAASVPMGKGSEKRLRQAIARALDEIDDG
jgi:hypothetical protein